MFVCMCAAVSEDEIKKSICNGNKTLTEVMDDLGVAMGCGDCQDKVIEMIHDDNKNNKNSNLLEIKQIID